MKYLYKVSNRLPKLVSDVIESGQGNIDMFRDNFLLILEEEFEPIIFDSSIDNFIDKVAKITVETDTADIVDLLKELWDLADKNMIMMSK